MLAASLSLSFQKTNRLEHKLCYEAMRFLTAKTYELKAGFPASLIQRGWKLTFSLLGGQIWTFLASGDLSERSARSPSAFLSDVLTHSTAHACSQIVTMTVERPR